MFYPTTFMIEEEVEWEGRQALVYRPGLLGPELIAQEEGRVYFWDGVLEEYQLNYDFNNDSVYYVRYYDYSLDDADSTAVFIDSVKILPFDGRNIQVQYCRSDFGFENANELFEVYRGIGRSAIGLRLPIQLFDAGVGNLRCFESLDCSIKFVDVPCDTSNITSVSDLKSSLDLKMHPNPVNDRLYIETTDQNWSYQVINLQGRQMMQGQYQDHIDVHQMPSGIYFLQMQKGGEWYQAIKFVKE